MENVLDNKWQSSPLFPLLRSLSGSSRMTKEWGNSDKEPLKLNLKVWLRRRLSLEKLFLLGGGAMPRPLSRAWGLILRSDKLSTNSRSIFSLILLLLCLYPRVFSVCLFKLLSITWVYNFVTKTNFPLKISFRLTIFTVVTFHHNINNKYFMFLTIISANKNFINFQVLFYPSPHNPTWSLQPTLATTRQEYSPTWSFLSQLVSNLALIKIILILFPTFT